MMLLLSALLLACLPLPSSSHVPLPSASPSLPPGPFRVAIVGSGVGGAMSAYFLRQSFPSPSSLSLTLYERSAYPGGRVQSVTIDGFPLEAGASIIHHTNAHLKNLSTALNLSVSQAKKDNSRMGVWNATSGTFAFTTTASSLFNAVKMVWHFGLSFFTLLSTVNAVAAKWTSLYPLQAANRSFAAPPALLDAVDLSTLTQQSIGSYLSALSPVLLSELVTPVLRVNYNQQLGVNALAGSVGLVPLTDDDVFAIDGGNRQLIDGAIRLSQASLLLNHTVQRITYQQTGAYLVEGALFSGLYDAVIIAGPLDQTGVALNLSTRVPPRPYKTTVATFVSGVINPAYFGYTRAADVPSTVLTTDCTATPHCPFSSLSQYFSNATSGTSVYKLFSSAVLSAEVLSALFLKYEEPVVYPWLAYPVFHQNETLTSWVQQLAGGGHVYYANAFEGAVSCMECAAVSAKNVALLVSKEVQDRARQREQKEQERLAHADRLEQQTMAHGGRLGKEDTGVRPLHLDL